MDYISSINVYQPKTRSLKDRNSLLVEEEKKGYRSLVGQLNWVATQTRPDISYDVCLLSTVFGEAKMQDLLHANKVVKRIKETPVVLRFNRLQSIESSTIECYSDASYANLRGGGSQGGFIIFIRDQLGQQCSLVWQSKRVRRVVKSTLSAETLALLDGAETAVYLSHLIGEIFSLKDGKLPVNCYTDSKSLVDALHSTKSVEDKSLRISIAVLMDMMNSGEVTSVQWVESGEQLADCFTKAGASSVKLIKAIS